MKRNQKKTSQTEQTLQDQQMYGFKRKDVIDAGHAQLKTLNRLDIELNEILANVLKEENRQRLLMQSLLKLIDKNKDQFFSADEISEAGELHFTLHGHALRDAFFFDKMLLYKLQRRIGLVSCLVRARNPTPTVTPSCV